MENLEAVVSILSYTLDSPRKRHLVGGILLSLSAALCGLAITAMTLGTAKENDEEENQ